MAYNFLPIPEHNTDEYYNENLCVSFINGDPNDLCVSNIQFSNQLVSSYQKMLIEHDTIIKEIQKEREVKRETRNKILTEYQEWFKTKSLTT